MFITPTIDGRIREERSRGPRDASVGRPPALLRCPRAMREQVLKEHALEALDGNGTPLRLRDEDRALQRADDETGKLAHVGVGRELARIDRSFETVRDRCLVFGEYRRDASSNR